MQNDDSYLIKLLLPILRFRVVRHYYIYGVRVTRENSGDAAGTLHINTLTRKYPDFTAEDWDQERLTFSIFFSGPLLILLRVVVRPEVK
ncbi:hypothetical protein RIR_jg28067.t1 [Rhizophagus irregularis DAOM 181602=DAOM 197198]|nr:hypothetical protein RIR_jg28067.t1 [Rhizophagus irregularis DAOM 181602=DAOM 197198]